MIVKLNWFELQFKNHAQHYNHDKYWSWREKVIDPDCKLPALVKLWYLYWIKKCDACNNATMGTHIGYGADFLSPPNLPHGLYGIVVSHNASVGRNCTIFHQVTIGETRGGGTAPKIGDNVIIGAGARIFGGVTIGNNVSIGANAVVVHDVPDNATVHAPEGIVIQK